MAAATGEGAAPTQRAEEKLQSSGLSADTTVVDVGDPVVRICEAARTQHADLIVVGDSHRSTWARLLRGDLVDDVRHAAPCPVLVVP
jgi:nucleotide-binding universal stress UspA family protein